VARHITRIPEELVEAFVRNDGSLFVGAGVSMGAGLPSWAELIEPLRSRIKDCPPLASLTEIAQLFEEQNGRRYLIDRIKAALHRPEIRPTAVHRALVSLPVTRIFTTNLDRLLETELDAQGVPYQQVVDSFAIALLTSSERQIFKVHGDLSNPKSIIITENDYARVFFGGSRPLVGPSRSNCNQGRFSL
jgi:hypothetical protein